MLRQKIEEFINLNADEEKAKFDMGLVQTKYPIKGLKNKDIENFAKVLASEKVDILEMPLDNHEEILLCGFTLSKTKIKGEEKIEIFKNKLLPVIDNWATCDMIVSRLKGLDQFEDFFIDLLQSKNPFEIRVGIVWLMKFQLKKDIRKTVNIIDENVKNTNYYVEMALAWCYAEALIYDFDYMMEFVQKLERYVVRNRTLQKACESFRVNNENKILVKKLRSKLLGMQIKFNCI